MKYIFRSAWGLQIVRQKNQRIVFHKTNVNFQWNNYNLIYNTTGTVKQSLKIESCHFNDFNDGELITAYTVTWRENDKCLKFYIQKYFLI